MKVTYELNGEEHTVDLPDDTVNALQLIAQRNGISLETAIQQAVANENFLEVQQANGTKLLVEQNGEIHEVVRKAQPA